MRAERLRFLLEAVVLKSLFLTLIIGLIVGLIASVVSSNKRGAAADLLLGILGSFLGSLFFFSLRDTAGFERGSGLILIQIVASLILILIGRL